VFVNPVIHGRVFVNPVIHGRVFVDLRRNAIMANTYTSLHYHIVFSTKNRVAYITPEIEARVWAYIGGVARAHHMTALQVGGIDDHIHALIMAPPTLAPSQIAQYIKGDSSKWIHETFPVLHRFAWQEGYGAFTVSKSGLEAVVHYIQHQRTHHQRKTFQEEYLAFLQRHGVDFDEGYVWG
jgi:REP element-mobilizing transposase RayT